VNKPLCAAGFGNYFVVSDKELSEAFSRMPLKNNLQ
jgi:hypothetical protein